jgi:hypothetical protein
MSHLAYNSVVNNELCLSLLNLDYTMFYPPHSIAALHVDEMPWETPIDDRWEHTQGTSLEKEHGSLVSEQFHSRFHEPGY